MDPIEEEEVFNLDEEVFEDDETYDEEAIPIEIQVSASVSSVMDVTSTLNVGLYMFQVPVLETEDCCRSMCCKRL